MSPPLLGQWWRRLPRRCRSLPPTQIQKPLLLPVSRGPSLAPSSSTKNQGFGSQEEAPGPHQQPESPQRLVQEGPGGGGAEWGIFTPKGPQSQAARAQPPLPTPKACALVSHGPAPASAPAATQPQPDSVTLILHKARGPTTVPPWYLVH